MKKKKEMISRGNPKIVSKFNNFNKQLTVLRRLCQLTPDWIDNVGSKQGNCARKNFRYSRSIKSGRLMKIEVTDMY